MKRKLTTVVIGVIIAMMFSQVLVANAEIGHNNSHSSCKCAGEPAIMEELESLINMCKQANTVEQLTDSLTERRGNVVISDVKVYPSASSMESRAAVATGKIDNHTVVRLYYDDNKSWVQFNVGINLSGISSADVLIPSESATYSWISTPSNEYGFVLPIDGMDISEDIGCRYGCELNGQLCEWCVANDPVFANRIHYGIDTNWRIAQGTPVRAMAGGQVISGVESDGSGWGHWVRIFHNNGLSTLYAHMEDPPVVVGYIPQGAYLGTVGGTGYVTGPHLHLEVYNSNNVKVDPYPYIVDAESYEGTCINPKTFVVFDGPLTLRSEPLSSSTNCGSIPNGTVVTISKIEPARDNFIFGYISSGTYTGRWIALGKTTIADETTIDNPEEISNEMYAANLTDQWLVYNGPLTIRESASSSSASYGQVTDGSRFYITEVYMADDYIFGKISSSSHLLLASGSTCTADNAKGHWVAIDFCTTY